MANAKYAELVDARLLEAAFHRLETARAAAAARDKLTTAREGYERAANAHMKAASDYDTLEADIARGVRAFTRQERAAVAS